MLAKWLETGLSSPIYETIHQSGPSFDLWDGPPLMSPNPTG